MKDLSTGIPEKEIPEYTLASLLLGRTAKEIFIVIFTYFRRFFKGAVCRQSPISTGRNDRLNLGELLNLTEYTDK